jgi:hypothetical protein
VAPSGPVTIQIDCKVFDADNEDEAALRETVNTARRKGRAGWGFTMALSLFPVYSPKSGLEGCAGLLSCGVIGELCD